MEMLPLFIFFYLHCKDVIQKKNSFNKHLNEVNSKLYLLVWILALFVPTIFFLFFFTEAIDFDYLYTAFD